MNTIGTLKRRGRQEAAKIHLLLALLLLTGAFTVRSTGTGLAAFDQTWR